MPKSLLGVNLSNVCSNIAQPTSSFGGLANILTKIYAKQRRRRCQLTGSALLFMPNMFNSTRAATVRPLTAQALMARIAADTRYCSTFAPGIQSLMNVWDSSLGSISIWVNPLCASMASNSPIEEAPEIHPE